MASHPPSRTVPPSAYAESRRRAAALAMTDPGRQGFYPVIGIVGSLIGMAVALGTIPIHPERPGALIFPATCLAIGLAVGPVVAAVLDPRNLLRTENIIGLCPIYWLLIEVIQGVVDLRGVTDRSIQMTFVYIGLYGACFWLGAASKGFRLPRSMLQSCALSMPVRLYFPITLLFFLIGMQAFAIPCRYDLSLMYHSLFVGRFEAPWAVSNIGGWTSFTAHLAYFGYLLPTLAAIQGRRLGWFRFETVVSIILAATIMAFIAQGGGRRIIGVCVGAAVMFLLLDQPKVKWSQLIPAFVAMMALLWAMQAILHFRNIGYGQAGQAAGQIASMELRGQGTGTGGMTIRVDTNFLSLCQLQDAVPKLHPYAYHAFAFYVLMRPIPRAFWKNKPVGGGYDLGADVGEGATLSTTLLGELHLSLGMFAVVVGSLLYGMASRMAEPLFRGRRGSVAPMFQAYISMWLFVGFRSMIEVMLFSYPLLAWMLVARLFQGSINRQLAQKRAVPVRS